MKHLSFILLLLKEVTNPMRVKKSYFPILRHAYLQAIGQSTHAQKNNVENCD